MSSNEEEDNVIRSYNDPRFQKVLDDIANGVIFRIVSTNETPFEPLIVEISDSDELLTLCGNFDTDETKALLEPEG